MSEEIDHRETITPEQEYLTTEQAAAVLGVPLRSIWDYCRNGTLPHFRLSKKRILIKREWIDKNMLTS